MVREKILNALRKLYNTETGDASAPPDYIAHVQRIYEFQGELKK